VTVMSTGALANTGADEPSEVAAVTQTRAKTAETRAAQSLTATVVDPAAPIRVTVADVADWAAVVLLIPTRDVGADEPPAVAVVVLAAAASRVTLAEPDPAATVVDVTW